MSSVSHIANLSVRSRIPGADIDVAQDETCRILAEAGHDLRQPVHALGLYVAELRRKISSREQRHLVGQVERSVDAISAMIDALFDISRLNAGTVRPKMQACDLSALLERIDADFQGSAKARNIRLVVRPCCGTVRSDPVLLERIAMNLVSNALRYTGEQGTVLIACRKRAGHVLFEVRDNGIGIEKSHQADIFREFFHLGDDNRQGLGLGLAIVDRLSKSLGHKVSLRSAPNRGSKFTLQLASMKTTLRPISPRVSPVCERGPLTGKKVRVLIRDEAMRDEIAGMLAGWGGEISATSEAGSLERQPGAAWDLLICDSKHAAGLARANTPCIVIGATPREDGALVLNVPVKPAKLRSLVQFALDTAAADN